MGYRVLRTGAAWVRLLWPHDHLHDGVVTTALQALGRMPGVRPGPNYVDLPCTVWGTLEAAHLWRVLGAVAPELWVPLAPEWFPERALFEHQWSGVEKLLSAPGVLLADDMGSGKTTTAIVAAERVRLAHPGQPALIVSTLSSRDVWRRELVAVGVREPMHALTGRDISVGWNPHATWIFVHFDIVLAWMTKLQGIKPCVAIMDEAHWIKNGRTQRGRGATAAVAIVPQRMLLTGTPVENRPGDLWNQLAILTGQYTWGSPVEFRVRYAGATYDGHGYQDGDTPTHVEELQARMAPFYLRRTIADLALALPPLTRRLQVCVLRHTLQREHDEVLGAHGVEQLVRALQTGAVHDNVLQTLTRLRQVTSAGKLDATCEYVTNVQAQGEGVVVFVWERETAETIALRTGGFKITGDDTQARRTQVIDMFQATPGAVLVATLGSLRESVTLHTARIVVMHDWHWVLTHMLQGEARVWRTGQRRACQSVWMMAENSIDTILARVLYAKAGAMQSVGIDKGREALEELGVGQLARDLVTDRVNEMLGAWL